MATKTNNHFGKLKSSVPNRQEGDGHEIKVEVREDEEQSAKLQEILDLLIAAGYFKARIKGLSSFDKVVGGMTWCIESCNVDVDVDLLFQENSTIGQKIALTEKIVGVLPKLQCPHQIQPHQIQGLDFIHVFPVIQWLVKRSIEHRSNTANFLYSYALNQFEKEFREKQEPSEKELNLIKNIKAVEEIYKPHRAFRRKHVLPIKDLDSKVQLTLLEYGYKNVSKHSSAEESSGESYLDQQLEEQLMNNLVVTVEETFDFDDLTQEDQKKLLNHYENLNKELKISGFKSVENQQNADLKDRTKMITDKLKKLEEQKLTLENKIETMNCALKGIRQRQMETDTAFKELDKEDINTEIVNDVQDLVIQSENLKKQEIEFRDKCKKELQQLRNSIEKAKERKSQSSEETSRNMELQLHEQNEKLKVLRLKVAKKSRVISVLQRRIDDVPCRAELAQYQRRFIELYNQSNSKYWS
ncbi:hypothetical protein WA026_015066 [Henosepilachna vigintioctopunctata]|uniref:Coiled-coil domain-containing protein 93 n=1 Tax=Henosepilachna vigintioctopunctata TaxID=420089 RepID=A0AAW1U9Y4_9CUCU